jgi:hypothetical protein
VVNDDGWPRGIKVVLAEDEEIRHCAHCDRYDDDNPLAHPSCLIVKVETRTDAAEARLRGRRWWWPF